MKRSELKAIIKECIINEVAGYVLDGIEDADKALGDAYGGMHYRMNERHPLDYKETDGYYPLTPDEKKRTGQAMTKLEQARKLVGEAAKLTRGIDYGYMGRKR